MYLTVNIDLSSPIVVGWAMNSRMKASLVAEALMTAYWRRKSVKGLLHHSDRRSLYAGDNYQRLLVTDGMICSMSRKGDCCDNAVAGSFFHSLKTEWP
ncbi:MAG: DDE-type integrase/transposase/recombinase [Deltaproteobacteria bacterium]|nr:DDE-type integrase/transposase/recombinase [Smithella sp.]NMC96117.1 DDE-type integrase/transposase/recombinase [Deltaproteobacteria bacterium]